MEIPKEHCRVYQDVKKYSENTWALQLAAAFQWAVAEAMEAKHDNECFDNCYPLVTDPSTGEAVCLKTDWDKPRWLVEADKLLMEKEQPK